MMSTYSERVKEFVLKLMMELHYSTIPTVQSHTRERMSEERSEKKS